MFLCSLLATGCAADRGEGSAVAQRDFFNLPRFVEQQQLALSGKPLKKTVVINGVAETRTIDPVEWAAEFEPFAQSDIDRPALVDRYQVDTLTDSETQTITYAALDEDLYTKQLVVTKATGKVVRIEIHNAKKSVIAETEQVLLWEPSHYEIKSIQQAILLDERKLEIMGDW